MSLIPQNKDRTWCINDAHLTNKSYCFDIQLALKEYLTHNTTPDLSPVLLWEAYKPVIRGTCISVSTHLKRDKKLKLQQLETEYHHHTTISPPLPPIPILPDRTSQNKVRKNQSGTRPATSRNGRQGHS